MLENWLILIYETMESVPCIYELYLKAHYKAENESINVLSCTHGIYSV